MEKPPKKLNEYKQSRPEQIELFEAILPQERRYSNTVELYDFMPKYIWGRLERINGKYLDPIIRTFECRGAGYQVRITPANLQGADGIPRNYFPGKREELVEDALRKLAVEGQAIFLDDEVGVTFTLYQLQQELKRNGHSYSLSELKDALLICAQTNLEVKTSDGKGILTGSLFETLGLQTREDWKGTGAKTKAFVRFNSLVTTSIKNRTYRQLNYETSMAYRNVIARQLHKRMSHHYTQASLVQPYHILLTTIIRDFGLTRYRWLSMNLRDVLTAIEEMKEKNVLISYDGEKLLDGEQRNKLIEAKLVLTPHPWFVQEIIKANARQKKLNK